MATCLNDADAEREETDPGAAPFGNFINYYTFNPPENRLGLIPASLLQELGFRSEEPTLILDVGCNSGELSVALYNHLVPGDQRRRIHLLGFDLDEVLIERAQQNNPLQSHITFIPLDITNNTEQLQDYLHLHGSSHFHLTLCLAVTMWVHLNHGDSGLLQLLTSLASISHFLLLEAQPWKCYRSAARRLRKLGRTDFDHFKTLEIKGDIAGHAKEHLEGHCGMELTHSFGNTTWDRKLLLFKKR
ncbi:pre-miRNA 5'-monophosphate methyltransferase [Gouania willdenowi]|uniref:RNA methyltransferase n=1 Tax=Gouania willdenowi TaxID=441366 RepID=A0A8C5GRK1_GOUWI|nr:RNA 5'-monophosphate methyltransferase [Gouania willdenowi]